MIPLKQHRFNIGYNSMSCMSLATGVAGASSFSGVNMSLPVPPPTNVLGLRPPPSDSNLGSIESVLNYPGYLGQYAAGRSPHFIAAFLDVVYYALRINNENIKKSKKKRALGAAR